jgi:hypothetical protein
MTKKLTYEVQREVSSYLLKAGIRGLLSNEVNRSIEKGVESGKWDATFAMDGMKIFEEDLKRFMKEAIDECRKEIREQSEGRH